MELTNLNSEDEMINTKLGNSLNKPFYKDNINYKNRKQILFNKIKDIPFIFLITLMIFVLLVICIIIYLVYIYFKFIFFFVSDSYISSYFHRYSSYQLRSKFFFSLAPKTGFFIPVGAESGRIFFQNGKSSSVSITVTL